MACVDSSLPYVLSVAKTLARLEHQKMALMKEIAGVRKQIKAIKLEGRMAGIKTELSADGPSIHETVDNNWSRMFACGKRPAQCSPSTSEGDDEDCEEQ